MIARLKAWLAELRRRRVQRRAQRENARLMRAHYEDHARVQRHLNSITYTAR